MWLNRLVNRFVFGVRRQKRIQGMTVSILTTERRVAGLDALVARVLAHNKSAAHSLVALRRHEVVREIERLVDKGTVCRSPADEYKNSPFPPRTIG